MAATYERGRRQTSRTLSSSAYSASSLRSSHRPRPHGFPSPLRPAGWWMKRKGRARTGGRRSKLALGPCGLALSVVLTATKAAGGQDSNSGWPESSARHCVASLRIPSLASLLASESRFCSSIVPPAWSVWTIAPNAFVFESPSLCIPSAVQTVRASVSFYTTLCCRTSRITPLPPPSHVLYMEQPKGGRTAFLPGTYSVRSLC